jgi:hypothetical protein
MAFQKLNPKTSASLDYPGSRAQHYREKARQVRLIAESKRTSALKAEYNGVADRYDHLAAQIEAGLLSD